MADMLRELDDLFVDALHLHRRSWHATVEPMGLHRGQPRLLRELWKEEGLTLGEMAERLSSQPATVTKMVRRLESNDFILRKPDAVDQRVTRLYLTDKGRNVRHELEDAWNAVRIRAYRGFSTEEQIIFKRLLLQMRRNLAE